jgi:hypothetical protein
MKVLRGAGRLVEIMLYMFADDDFHHVAFVRGLLLVVVSIHMVRNCTSAHNFGWLFSRMESSHPTSPLRLRLYSCFESHWGASDFTGFHEVWKQDTYTEDSISLRRANNLHSTDYIAPNETGIYNA